MYDTGNLIEQAGHRFAFYRRTKPSALRCPVCEQRLGAFGSWPRVESPVGLVRGTLQLVHFGCGDALDEALDRVVSVGVDRDIVRVQGVELHHRNR